LVPAPPFAQTTAQASGTTPSVIAAGVKSKVASSAA